METMKVEVNDLSLLVYLMVVNHKPFAKVMHKWSGCDEEVYKEKDEIELLENALTNITNAHFIPNMFYHYFDGKRTQRILEMFGKYKYSEVDVLRGVFIWIPADTWTEEEKARLIKLKKEYIDEVE